jgi:methyltransferase (TIGR00027 family)
MKEGKPSLTAELACACRAAESLKAAHKRVCYDPLARHFVRLLLRLIARSRLLVDIILWEAERLAPGVPGEVIGRTRYIDDLLKKRLEEGIEQLVILGAGYDTRPYRFEELKQGVRVFEVDFPSTQAVKMKKVKKVLGALPEHVSFVPMDFNRDSLDEKLFGSGYDKALKTFFIWEGVTYYITERAVDETLAFMAKNSGEGSSVVFDYAFRSVLQGHSDIDQVNRILKAYETVAAPITSEHFVFGVDEGSIEEFLGNRGFVAAENVTGEFFESEYFKGVHQKREVSRLCGFVHAAVDSSRPI